LEAPSRKGVRCPDSLNKIKFTYEYNKPTINTLPIGINEVEFHKINKQVNNLPITVQIIKVNDLSDSNLLLLKIPFGCIVIDANDKIINI